MTKARNIADLLDANGDVKSASLDNVPASNDASALTTGTIPNARISLDANEIPNLDTAKITTGTFADARIADLSASKLTGSIADARIPASAVSQHVTSFDDTNIINDLSTVALRSATTENAVAYNTNSSFIDVFQDSSGIASHTTSARNSAEFISTETVATDSNFVFALDMTSSTVNALHSASTIGFSNNIGGGITKETRAGSPSTYVSQFGTTNNNWMKINDSDTINLSGDFCIDFWVYNIGYNSSARLWSKVGNGGAIYEYYLRPGGQLYLGGRGDGTADTSMTNGVWYYVALDMDGTKLNKYINGTRVEQKTMTSTANTNDDSNMYIGGAWIDDTNYNNQYPNIEIGGMRYSKGASRYGSASSITVPTGELTNVSSSLTATGNFISNTITAPSSKSKIGAIITYEDASGTNALNTDIILQLSADNGSNYSTATLTALPNYSTGIKMAKVNDLSVTAGTQLKYKISFANQSKGSKEARIRGVSLQY